MGQPPSGTVTFLFTDIEGSTRLWEEHPEAMGEALARHNVLVSSAIDAHGGYTFDNPGDGFCAAFAAAPAALAAAIEVQRSLSAEAWRDPAGTFPGLGVRVALHTGTADAQSGTYAGAPLNRCSRLVAIGHGGQMLVSLVTQELLRGQLPAGVHLTDLGEHRLRDVARHERVFQVIAPGLAERFAPLNSLDAHAHNLPVQVTSFIGREAELSEIKALLGGYRLLTLTGVGGTGKSRLAIQVAAEIVDHYADGAWHIQLAQVDDPAQVCHAVGTALGVREQPRQTMIQTLSDVLRPKSMLLLLDNCEHLIGAVAELADYLMRQTPGVGMLVTSREPLGIAGEVSWPVPSLSLPEAGPHGNGDGAALEALAQTESAQLFIDRALTVQPRFRLDEHNAHSVAEVCRRLDGIPLAIEMAAARVKLLAVDELALRLDDCFRVLTGGSRTALPRQQTLRAAIDWSHDLLEDDEKVLFRRMAVFSAGWNMDAAEAICSGGGLSEGDVLGVMGHLVDKSLVVPGDQSSAGPYRMLNTIRQYARERLTESGEEQQVRDGHLSHFVDRASAVRSSASLADRLSRLDADYPDMRAALEWAIETEQVESASRLSSALLDYWLVRGHWSEGDALQDRILALPATRDQPPRHAAALYRRGLLRSRQGNYATARDSYEQALAIRQKEGDEQGVSKIFNNLGELAHTGGDLEAAREYLSQSLAIKRRLGDEEGIANSLNNLGILAREQGDYETARRHLEESLAIKRRLGDTPLIASTLINLANVAREQGDLDAAQALYEESLASFGRIGNRQGIAVALNNLGGLATARRDTATARRLHAESLTIYRELGDRNGTALALLRLATAARLDDNRETAYRSIHESVAISSELADPALAIQALEEYACIAASAGDAAPAARALGAATAGRSELGIQLPVAQRDELDAAAAAAASALGADVFEAMRREGGETTVAEACARALAGTLGHP